MNLLLLVLLSVVLLSLGYFIYGSLLSRWLKLRDDVSTPAHEMNNGVDFVPTDRFYLLNQHLSAIAAAGPIVGPILAGMWFGWLPTFIWIIFGGIFIGGVHDMISIIASVRHKGQSIAEVIRATMSKKIFTVFLFFLWFSLVYIICAFTDVTSSTFAEATRGAGIASSSTLYLLLALVMGLFLKKITLPLSVTTAVSLPLVLLCIYLGPHFPIHLPSIFGYDERMSWNVVLLAYCFFAAIAPVWLLLQPRGYLGGFFLLLTAGLSLIGLSIGSLTGSYSIHYPAFISFHNSQGMPLVPILFITVACGACSGFHCLIASGTTSKQLSKESDARVIGYGGMLLESFIAVIALGTLAVLNADQVKTLKSPDQIYANGIAMFLNSFGIDKNFAYNFALLAFATFVFDTLDVATRLGRYIFEEITGWKNKWSPYVATFATLVLPFWFVSRTMTDPDGNRIAGWKVFWTVFGSSNQLLAALVLFGLSVWLFKVRMKFIYALWPAVFMILIAVASIILIIKPWLMMMVMGKTLILDPIGITCVILLALTALIVVEGVHIFIKTGKSKF